MLLATVAVAMSGCGGDSIDGLVAAKGTIKQGGTPLEGASVIFSSAAGYTAFATTDAQGNFSLFTRNQEGANPGTYKVMVTKIPAGAAPAPTTTTGDVAAVPDPSAVKEEPLAEGPKNQLNAKYATKESTPLEAVVDKDASKNVFEFDLEP